MSRSRPSDESPVAESAGAESTGTEGGKVGAKTRAGTHRGRRARKRTFYSIGEVCATFDLKPHVLRYWETQFPQLRPSKNRAGARAYQAAELETIALIHRLVHEEHYTIEGARLKMDEMNATGGVAESAARSFDRAVLNSMKADLELVLELLGASADDT